MTMNDTWGYKSYDNNWKSSEILIRNLIDIASKGGNYLLNVGPTSEGLIPAPSVERLKEVGRWMKANGEAIYATTASPFKRLAWGRCTKKVSGKETTLYLHVFDWPSDGQLILPGLKNKAEKAYLLNDHKRLALESRADSVVIKVPSTAPDPVSSTVVLHIQGAPEVDQPGIVQADDGSLILPASEAQLHGSQLQYEKSDQRDNIGFWLNPEDWAHWDCNVTKAGRFKVVADIAAPAVSSFRIVAGGQSLKGAAKVTGDYGKFEANSLGEITLPSGKVNVEVRPDKSAWTPMNLKRLKLTRIGD